MSQTFVKRYWTATRRRKADVALLKTRKIDELGKSQRAGGHFRGRLPT
jgi:hypothetical protein